jgi:hypothetical protein
VTILLVLCDLLAMVIITKDKKRHVAILWPAGHAKNALEKACK